MFGQRTLFSIVNLVFLGYCESYLFYYNAIFEDRVLFKKTQLSIEIDVILKSKNICSLFKFY